MAQLKFKLARSFVLSAAAVIEHAAHITIDLPYPPFADLMQQLEDLLKVKLQSRGEAHITLLRGKEAEILQSGSISGGFSMLELAKQARTVIDGAEVEFICLGRGQAELGGQLESTYYIVVQSQRLLEIREFLGLGTDYFPHVTLGFTERDLHREDGVLKNASSCILQLTYENGN